MRILSVVRQDCNPIGQFFGDFCHFLCLLQLSFARFWGHGVVYWGISARFMLQASSGTLRADGPMDFAVRDEPAWIPSRKKPALSLAVGTCCHGHAKILASFRARVRWWRFQGSVAGRGIAHEAAKEASGAVGLDGIRPGAEPGLAGLRSEVVGCSQAGAGLGLPRYWPRSGGWFPDRRGRGHTAACGAITPGGGSWLPVDPRVATWGTCGVAFWLPRQPSGSLFSNRLGGQQPQLRRNPPRPAAPQPP